MAVKSVPLFGAPDPGDRWDRENEAQFRRAVEQYLFELRSLLQEITEDTTTATAPVANIVQLSYHHRMKFR